MSGFLLNPNNQSSGSGGSSPLTTKGDLYGFSTVDARIPVGADGTVLTADSSSPLGVSYQPPQTGGVFTYYWTPTASDVASQYKQLDTPYATLSTFTTSGATNGQLLRTYVTDPNQPGLSFIPAGTYKTHIHANVATISGKKDTYLRAEIWEVDSAGVDIVKLADVGPTVVLTAVSAEYIIEYSTVQINLASTSSRIATKLYATVSGTGGQPDITVSVGDGTDSNTTFPAATVSVNNFVPYTGATKDVDLGSHDLSVQDEAYGAGWDGSMEVPTKNALYDKIETISTPPGGSDGQVQYNNGGAFNGFGKWDDLNNYLGVNQETPLASVHAGSNTTTSATPSGFGFTYIPKESDGYFFTESPLDYYLYSYKSVGAGTVYSSSTYTSCTAPFSSIFDPTNLAGNINTGGSGYIQSGQNLNYVVYAIYGSKISPDSTSVAVNLDYSGNPCSVDLTWDHPSNGAASSYLIILNSTYSTISYTNSVTDDNSWSSFPGGYTSIDSWAPVFTWDTDPLATGFVLYEYVYSRYTTITSSPVTDNNDGTWTAGVPDTTPTSLATPSLYSDGTTELIKSGTGDLGFWDATAVPQQTGDIRTALGLYGLVTSGTYDTGGLNGTVAIAQGGTNNTSYTTNQIPYFNGSSISGSSGLWKSNAGMAINLSTGGLDVLHMHRPAVAASLSWFTNSTTGTTGSAGMKVGITSAGAGDMTVVGNLALTFGTNNTSRWNISSSGHFLANTDNTLDIGASGATRPRTAYFGTSLFSPLVTGATTASGTLTLSSTSNATKGKILFGTSMYDEANNWFGINITPAVPLDVYSTTTSIGRVGNTNGSFSIGFDSAGGFFQPFTASKGFYFYNAAGTSYMGVSGTVGVGVNTTSPGSTFSVNGSASFGTYAASAAPSNGLVVSGSMGIGTITVPEKLTVASGNILMTGSYGLKWTGGSQLIEQTVAINGVDRMIYLPNGDRIDFITESGSQFMFAIRLSEISFYTNGTIRQYIDANGKTGFGGVTSPTAWVHLPAGAAAANSAPLKFTTGVNLTTAVSGAVEYDNTFYMTQSDATRRSVVLATNATKTTAGAPYTNDGYITIRIGGTDVKVMTTA